MGFFNKRKDSVTLIVDEAPKNDSVNGFSLRMATDLPKIIETKGKDWVSYGVDNDYPTYLKDLFNTSPTHQAIVKSKSLMVVGNGYTINDEHLDELDKIKVKQLLNQVDDYIYDTSLDYQIYGAFAYEIIWSLDFSKIVRINRVDPSKIRSGKFVNGYVDKYYFSNDWTDRKEEVIDIYSFEESDGQNFRQLMYVAGQQVSNSYYGEPSYLATIDWINLESSTGLYYKSVVDNGFTPSILVKFYNQPQTEEEKSTIVKALQKTYAGVKNAGKAMVMWSSSKELAPDITPIESSGVDKQFTIIADQIVTKILTGHRVTTPELFGLAIPGKLGSADFATQVQTFNQLVISPDQKIIEKTINKILLTNGYDVDFKFKPFKIESI
jgi:hypothetical protein